MKSLASLEKWLAAFIEEHPAAAGQEFAATIASDARRAADMLNAIPPPDNLTLPLPGVPTLLQDDPVTLSEYLADAYLRFAEASKSPELLLIAQDLAAIAVYRLATLQSTDGAAPTC